MAVAGVGASCCQGYRSTGRATDVVREGEKAAGGLYSRTQDGREIVGVGVGGVY